MRCEQLRDLILLRAAGPLEPEEESAIREHLDAGCPVCTSEMAAARSVLELLPYALPQETPSPMAKARLMSAARGDGITRGASSPAPAGVRPRTTWVAAAACLVGFAALIAVILRQEQVIEQGRSLVATLTERLQRQGEELASLTRQVRAARESIRFVSSPGVLTVDLSGQGNRADSAARVFWDRRRDSWQLYADNVPAPAPGRTYQLWLVTDTGVKISAGVFDTAGEPAVAGTVAVPPDAGTVVAAAVTDEPSGGSPQPTTQPFLLGRI